MVNLSGYVDWISYDRGTLSAPAFISITLGEPEGGKTTRVIAIGKMAKKLANSIRENDRITVALEGIEVKDFEVHGE